MEILISIIFCAVGAVAGAYIGGELIIKPMLSRFLDELENLNKGG